MSDKKPETPAVEHIELDEVQLDAAVGGNAATIAPCVKLNIHPCIKQLTPCFKTIVPCVKVARPG